MNIGQGPERGEVIQGITPSTFDVPNVVVPGRRLAERLNAGNPAHLDRTVRIIVDGGTVVFDFNGVYGIFANADTEKGARKIVDAKLRPQDKKLVTVPLPEYIDEVADVERSGVKKKSLEDLLRGIHALGVIFYAATTAPYHLVQKRDDGESTTLSIYTEHPPVRYILENLRKLGGRALVGTSANKSGAATHWQYEPVYEEFKYDVDAVVAATPDPNFMNLSKLRLRSTSVVDFTERAPRLFRAGNVSEREIQRKLKEYGLPAMIVGRDVITVRPRDYSNMRPSATIQ